jgi:hypothetical protein
MHRLREEQTYKMVKLHRASPPGAVGTTVNDFKAI